MVLKQEGLDPRIYCNYQSLIHLQGQANAFSLLPNLKSGSILAGRHGSRFRGRGLNFEELRHYQLGDDIRNLDWKVTMRTGKPHVRVYTEEKDFNVILCVDQSSSMFFSSIDTMKSVVAAELSALTAWRVLKDNDRVGFLLFDDTKVQWLKPRRSQKDLLHNLGLLTDSNQRLNANTPPHSKLSFSDMIKRLTEMKVKNSIIVLFSDWNRATEEDLVRLKQLQRHNDILGILISDPMEKSLVHVSTSNWVLSDGQYQLNIDNNKSAQKASEELQQRHQLIKENLRQLMAAKRLPLIEIGTTGNHITEFKRAFGAVL